MNGVVFNVSCPDCILTNCISQVNDHTHVLVLKQPSFVMLPVHANDPWFDDKESKKALGRQKRAIGLVVAGISALMLF